MHGHASRFADLLSPAAPHTYRGEERGQIAMPIGGIGAGSISIGGWGQLRDFEIFNRPAKGLNCPMAFFSLYARREGSPAVTRVIQGPLAGPREYPHGFPFQDGAGLPHFDENTFTGAFPFARLDFADAEVPLAVALEAYNPMIPLEEDDSSLPIAIFLVRLRNPSRTKAVRAAVFANMQNLAGHPQLGRNVTEFARAGSLRGLRMTTAKHAPDSPLFGSLALATTWPRVQIQTRWPRVPVFDQLQLFWDQVQAGRLKERRDRQESADGRSDVAGIAMSVNLAPGASAVIPVMIAWHVPNVAKYWAQPPAGSVGCCGDKEAPRPPQWRNHYATRFPDAWAVARYAARNAARLEQSSRRFADALYSSTLPAAAVDAAGSQLAVLKSTTCLRLEDGSFYGWEGCHQAAGCCEGTCSHVWNYAQTLAWLYPRLQASAIANHLNHCLQEDGAMTFRLPLPLGAQPEQAFFPAADGQMGIVLGAYRHWQLTGDDEWLARHWPRVQRALEYAWKYWDADRDGVMEGLQHNTYDIEFYGPNTMMSSLYLAALRAGERMARHLGQVAAADTYRALAERGARKIDAELFHGGYYIQRVEPQAAKLSPLPADATAIFARMRDDSVLRPGEPPYQYGVGCLSDQLIGQWYAHLLDLGHVLDPAHVRSAMDSVFRHNFRASLARHANTHRVYAAGDEAGLLLCTWPRGGRETSPFIYAHEVWPGIEYQVAAHLIMEGRVSEGMQIVRAVRDRHDGLRRNPWNEVECGNHYARSLASWSLILALSGFHYDAPTGRLRFAPRVHAADFRTFFSTGSAWGTYRQVIRDAAPTGARARRRKPHRDPSCAAAFEAEIRVESGRLPVKTLVIDPPVRGSAVPPVTVRLAGRTIACRATWTDATSAPRPERRLEIAFAREVLIRPGASFRVSRP